MSVDIEVQIHNLFEEIQTGQPPVTIEEAEEFPMTVLARPGPPGRERVQRGWVIGLAAGAVVLVLGLVAFLTAGTAPDAQVGSETTWNHKVSTAEAFFVAFLEGDLASARNMADDRYSSDLDGPEDVNTLWDIKIVGIDCEPVPAGATVTCVSTQIDDLSRRISPDYTHRITGKITVEDGLVTDFEVGFADSDFGRYETWLDDTAPVRWVINECSHGGWGAPVCVEIYLANFEAWLGTNPDLSDIER